MKKFLVVIWGDSNAIMSFVPLTPHLAREIVIDPSIAYSEAMGAELSLPAMIVEECNEHVDGFKDLKNGFIVVITNELKDLLMSLIPAQCQAG